MNDIIIQKAIALIILISVGYFLQQKFQDAAAKGAIRGFILNAALPATIFISTLEINTRLDLVRLPVFALAVNIYLMIVGFALSKLLISSTEYAKQRALILLFPSLAPGLTIYPFIEQFLGQQGLAWAALADMGNKMFVLIGLYAIAMVWYQKTMSRTQVGVSEQWRSIVGFLVSEPVNLAIVAGFILASVGLTETKLPFALIDSAKKLALCATPLILFYVGLSLNFKSLQFGKILMILVARSGVGFLFSAMAIALLNPTSVEETTLFVALPQASCSLWPLLHATKINTQHSVQSQENPSSREDFFDTHFATSLLAMSFPFSILVLLVVFSSGNFFYSPNHLQGLGWLLLILFTFLFGLTLQPLRLQNPIQINFLFRNPLIFPHRFHHHKAVYDLPIALPPAPLEEVQPLEFSLKQPQRLEQSLDGLNILMEKYLYFEMNEQSIALKLRYSLKGRVIIVLGKHKQGSHIDFTSVLEFLEKEVRLLNLEFADQIRFYFRFQGVQKPYICYLLMLNAEAPENYIAQM
jgi:malate permease and related proteins